MRASALLATLAMVAASAAAEPAAGGETEAYLQPGDGVDQDIPMELDEYSNILANLLRKSAQKRSCIRRGSSCDARPHDCCGSGTCRCNLWGSNCKCSRGSLFQMWGRRRK